LTNSDKLIDTFGGLTAYTRAPAEAARLALQITAPRLTPERQKAAAPAYAFSPRPAHGF
jgi:hypothetical protein